MSSTSPPIKSPFIFGYSMILPGIWVVVAVVAALIAPGRRLGIVGTALLFMAAAALTSWLFAKRNRRQYSARELWWLVVYCTVWAVLLELFVLFTVIVLPQIEAGEAHIKPLLVAVPITVCLDALIVWLAFRQTGRRVVEWYLEKRNADEKNA